MATGYIQKTFNVSLIDELDRNWRDLVYRTISRVTITKLNNSVFLNLEPRVVKNSTINGKVLGIKVHTHP